MYNTNLFSIKKHNCIFTLRKGDEYTLYPYAWFIENKEGLTCQVFVYEDGGVAYSHPEYFPESAKKFMREILAPAVNLLAAIENSKHGINVENNKKNLALLSILTQNHIVRIVSINYSKGYNDFLVNLL